MKKNLKNLILVALMFLIAIMSLPVAFGEYHIKLLAVKEGAGDVQEGSIADLYLDIQPGQGRVFLETYPLSKIDTQISTRFAKDIACDFVKEDCDKYDFFYTMRADSPIVGGPSAGAAVAVLTAASLKGWKIDENIAITGTINSGGLIGPVGGLSEKVEAAAMNNMTKVLVSKGSRFVKKMNLTFDLIEYAKGLNSSAIEVIDLNDAIFEFTGKRVKDGTKEIVIDEEYTNIMKQLGYELCNRSNQLREEVMLLKLTGNNLTLKEQADNLTAKGMKDLEKKSFYSGASYCFGANVKYREITLKYKKQIKLEQFKQLLAKLQGEAEGEYKNIKTIADLEAYMIVEERLSDANKSLSEFEKDYEEGIRDEAKLAYSIERMYSAETWMRFFGKKGKEFIFNDAVLQKSCFNKLSEAEERLQYTRIYFPSLLEDVELEINSARNDADAKNYVLCLSKASKAKAEADSVITVIGINEEDAPGLIENRLQVVKRVIADQPEGVFPILGYSYYEYAQSLKKDDIYSALLYSEYALELSDLDMYFKEKDAKSLGFDLRMDNAAVAWIAIFCGGLLLGFVIGYSVCKLQKQQKGSKSVQKTTRKKARQKK